MAISLGDAKNRCREKIYKPVFGNFFFCQQTALIYGSPLGLDTISNQSRGSEEIAADARLPAAINSRLSYMVNIEPRAH